MYKTWEELMEGESSELLNTEVTFGSMVKGVMHYHGNYEGKPVYCSVSEVYVSEYNYSAVESVSTVTQGEYVYLAVDGKEMLNTH